MILSPILEYWFHIFRASKHVTVVLGKFQEVGTLELGRENRFQI